MEPVTSIVSAILVVLQEIAKAERAAHRNRARCRDLAERARAVSTVLGDASSRTTTTAPGVSGDGASSSSGTTKRVVLRRLREALDDALKLVRSCGHHQRDDDDDDDSRLLLSWLSARLYYGRARAARFDDVDKRINHCLAELNAASGAVIEKKIDSLVAAVERITKNPPIKDDTRAGNVAQQKGGATGKGGGQQNGGKKDGPQNGGKKGSLQNGGMSGPRNGGNGGKSSTRVKNEAAAAARPTPALVLARAGVVPFPPFWLSVEEDPTSCSVM